MNKLILISMIAFALCSPYAQAGSPTSGEKAATNAPGANVSINRCTLKQIASAKESNCKRASYPSLSAKDRAVLDRSLALTRGDNQ